MPRASQPCLDHRLLHTAAAAWQALALAPHSLGGPRGMLALASQPPVPSRVPGGALSPDGATGRAPRAPAWRVPGRALARRFRGTCQAALPPAGLAQRGPPQVWDQAGGTPGPPAGTGPEGLAACAPSLSRLASTPKRLEALDAGPVPCRGTKRPGTGWTRLPLPAAAWLHRFLPPGLPKGCPTVRASGLVRPRRRTGLPQRRTRLAAGPSHAPAAARAPARPRPQPSPSPTQARRGRGWGGLLICLGRRAPYPREPPEAPHRLPRPPR